MRFLKGTFSGVVMIFVLMAIVLFIREPKLFSEPNTWLIDDTYDGFRSYAALVYHVKHDSTYSHYEGMNYPYGDKAAFTDNLPLLANSIKFVSQNIVDVSNHCGGILNIFLMLSIILCGVFIFLSFKTLKLPNWYTVPVAIGISLLSPQLFRLSAHYGLAHPFVIPMIFWLSLLFHQKKTWIFSLLIALALFLTAQLHFYLFAIAGAFILALMFFKTLFAFNRKAFLINCLHVFVQVVLPVLVIQLMMSDDLLDRPSKPFGFFYYKASLASVFLPVDFQIGRWIDTYIYEIPNFEREGIAFIGILSLLFLIKETILKIWNRIFGKEYFTFLPTDHRFFLKSAFWASFLVLIFSLGIPFVFEPFKEIPSKLGVLSQFRSIGRFAWVFFYVINIIAFYALYFQIKKIKKQGWQTIIYVLLIGIVLFESMVFLFDKVDLKLWKTPAQRVDYQLKDNAWIEKLNTEDYQAILAVPFFHIGSENFWVSPIKKGVHRPLWVSVQTGLPINASFMGRTSVGQIANQLELIAEPYRSPQLLKDLPNQKDFLVFIYKEGYKQVRGQYAHFIAGLEIVHEDKTIKVLRLPIRILQQRVLEKAKKTQEEYQNATLFKHDNWQSTDSLKRLVYFNFDDRKSEQQYKGTGAFESPGLPEQILFDGHLPFQQTDEAYVFSVWSYMQGDLNPKVRISIEEYQAGTNYSMYRQEYELNKYFRSMEDGWILCEFPFKLGRPDTRIRIKVWNTDLESKSLFMDELQIRKKSTKIYLRTSDELMFNNRWFSN